MRLFLRPRWLVVHVTVIALAVLFVNLAFWQLRRLDERKADNAAIAANMSAPEMELDDAFAQFGNDPGALVYRRVRVRGSYLPADEFLLTPRSHRGQAGHHVVTPLKLQDGSAVLIDRGWVPFDMDVPPVSAAAPPAGEVTVQGILYPTRDAVRFGTRRGEEGKLTYLSTVDVDRIQPQIAVSLLPVSVLLQQQAPSAGGLPIPGPLPEQSEGSHLSYAWQWFFFTLILLGGYPLLLRRSWRARTEQPVDAPEPVVAEHV